MENNSAPRIYGLIGYPVKHSLSPVMHNAAFKKLKINAEYKIFEVPPEDLKNFLLEKVFDLGISGFNITIPHKVKAKEILEAEFPPDKNKKQTIENEYYVKLSGAVNTVRRDGAKLFYYNTDASGFLKSLEQDLKFQPQNKVVLIFGCGGAGRAIIAALSWRNVGINEIYVYDIDKEKILSAQRHFANFEQLGSKLHFISSGEIPSVIKGCDLLINATAVGMKEGDGALVEKSLLHKNLSVYDVVYNRQTQLIQDAKSMGLPNKDGLSMLLYQGAHSFEIWTEGPAPLEVMRQALLKAVGTAHQ